MAKKAKHKTFRQDTMCITSSGKVFKRVVTCQKYLTRFMDVLTETTWIHFTALLSSAEYKLMCAEIFVCLFNLFELWLAFSFCCYGLFKFA